jgi:hypothetical protein
MKCFQLGFCLLMAGVSMGQIVPMTNDDCGTALVLADGINPAAPTGLSGNYFTNAGATNSVGVPGNCDAFNSDVWFIYNATGTGAVRFSLCTPAGFAAGTVADSMIQILDGSTCPPTTVLACDDDGGCATAAGTGGMTTACVSAGSNYYIRVAGWGTSLNTPQGTFYVSVTYVVAPTLPNDDCSGAIALSAGPNGPFGNAGATDSCAAANCAAAASPGFNDVWFSYTAGCCGVHTVDTGCAALAVDTVVTVYATCGGASISCNDDCVGFLASSAAWTASSGVNYLIRVASWSAITVGSFTVTITPPNPGVSGMSSIFTYPFGAGSLQIDICNGPLFGNYFLAVTFAAGTFPSGWFYGLDLFPSELANLINLGFPFIGPLDATCGAFTIGPFTGVNFLSGVPIYAVVLAANPAAFVPVTSGTPTLAVIP